MFQSCRNELCQPICCCSIDVLLTARRWTVTELTVCSGVTKVGVIRCGSWWCHPILPPKVDHSFSHRRQKWWPFSWSSFYTFTPLPPSPQFPLSGVLVNSATKITLLFRCHPLVNVTRGLSLSDATESFIIIIILFRPAVQNSSYKISTHSEQDSKALVERQ